MNRQALETAAVWMQRSFTAILVFLSTQIYFDVKQLTQDVPVMKEQIKKLEEGQQRLTNKVYPAFANPAVLKTDFFYISKNSNEKYIRR